MTTDSGVDLVVFSAKQDRAWTVQVKTCQAPKAAGGRGRLALDWRLESANAAQVVGLADLHGERAWLFDRSMFNRIAQQDTGTDRHFYAYTDTDYTPTRANCHVRDFDADLIDLAAQRLFGTQARRWGNGLAPSLAGRRSSLKLMVSSTTESDESAPSIIEGRP